MTLSARPFLTAALFAALAPLPVAAETVTELDRLSQATDEPGSGIALARKHIDSGDLLDALAALERVILNHPHHSEARLLHASLLCRLDDKRGALPEFEGLQGHDLDEDAVAAARRPCAETPGGGA